MNKVCRKCGVDKPITSFPKRYNGSGTREHTCGMCKKRAWLKNNPAKASEYRVDEGIRRRAREKGMSVDEYQSFRIAHKIEIELRLPRLQKRRSVKCPVLRAHCRLDYLVNAEYYKAKYREYHAANPVKARARRHRRRARFSEVFQDLTDAQWREIQQRFDHRCAYCDRKTKLTIDHITPISKGGPHTASNVVPSCHRCNVRKRVGPPLRTVQPMLIC